MMCVLQKPGVRVCVCVCVCVMQIRSCQRFDDDSIVGSEYSVETAGH